MEDNIEKRSEPVEALTPAELIKKHNADPNHVITDEDLKNLKVGQDAEDKDEHNREVEDREAEEKPDRHNNNPYDILNG